MLDFCFLGAMAMHRDGVAQRLPASRKTRALLAWLVLEPRHHRRERLCSLLWEIPDDPRAALRWSLAKLRPLLDRPDRIGGGRDEIWLEGGDLDCDVTAVRNAVTAGLTTHATDDLARLLDRMRGRFLEDSELPAQPEFQAWIVAIRHEMQAAETAICAALLARPVPPGQRLALLDRLLANDPYDTARHRERIALLAASGERGEAERAAEAATTLLADAGIATSALMAAARNGPATRDHAEPARAGVIAAITVQPFEAAGEPVTASTLADLVATGVADWLSRFASLRVVPAGKAGGGPGRATGYALGGTVIVAGGRARVRYRLFDTDSGEQVWAGEIERSGDDLLALDEALATAIAAVIEPRVRYTEVAAARTLPASAASAREFFLQALGHAVGDGDFAAMLACLHAALAQQPDYALAGAFLPWAALQSGVIADTESRAANAEIARRAVHAAPDDVIVQAIGGLMLVLLDDDFAGGMASIDRALQRNPNAMFGWMARGWAAVHAGDDAAALADFDEAARLSPADPTDNSINAGRAIACFQAGDLAAADHWTRIALARSRTSLEAYRVAIAVAVEQQRPDDARALARQLLALSPAERARRARLLPFRRRETAERLYRAYLDAGLPD
jgi:DNA-binding SARP family transcriptional activator/tetratricopeptide (TPR) repeat protein